MGISTLLRNLFLLLVFIPFNLLAQGNLLIYPKRIVFDNAKKILDINLANTGNDSTTYLISLIQIRMKEDGTFENITEPDSGQYFATKYLRIFPRTVTLGPKESQTVKIQVIQTGGLAPGEYRSHIYFRAAPSAPGGGERNVIADSSKLAVRLVPVFGISIPAIIQVGENISMSNISDISTDLKKDRPQLSLCLNRNGNMSVYGDILVDHISPGGKKTRVNTTEGVAVYTPLLKRRISISLDQSRGIDYHKGTLQVSYVSSGKAKSSILSQKELSLQ